MVGLDSNEDSNEDTGTEELKPITNPEAIKLQKDVGETIKAKQDSGEIRKRVVDALVEEEMDCRTDLLTKALARRKAQAKEVEKIKPDQEGFDVNGKVISQSWTRAKLVERTKAIKALSSIDKAINAAVNDADYNGVKKFGS